MLIDSLIPENFEDLPRYKQMAIRLHIKDVVIAEKDAVIADKYKAIAEKDARIAEEYKSIAEKDKEIAILKLKNIVLSPNE